MSMRRLWVVFEILVLSVNVAGQGFALALGLPSQRQQMAQILGMNRKSLRSSMGSLRVLRSGPVTAENVFVTHLQPVLASNGNNCASCHVTPGTGGSSNIAVTR